MPLPNYPHRKIKDQIRAEILSKYGSVQKFIEVHPSAQLNYVSVSHWLNPAKNCTMNSLQRLMDILGIEFTLARKMNLPELFTPEHYL